MNYDDDVTADELLIGRLLRLESDAKAWKDGFERIEALFDEIMIQLNNAVSFIPDDKTINSYVNYLPFHLQTEYLMFADNVSSLRKAIIGEDNEK